MLQHVRYSQRARDGVCGDACELLDELQLDAVDALLVAGFSENEPAIVVRAHTRFPRLQIFVWSTAPVAALERDMMAVGVSEPNLVHLVRTFSPRVQSGLFDKLEALRSELGSERELSTAAVDGFLCGRLIAAASSLSRVPQTMPFTGADLLDVLYRDVQRIPVGDSIVLGPFGKVAPDSLRCDVGMQTSYVLAYNPATSHFEVR